MATYHNETEQLAAIKQWWDKNAKSVIVGVATGVGLLFGWQAWQTHQLNQGMAASDQYAELQKVLKAEPEQTASITAGADQLLQDYPGTVYAVLAGRQAAKAAYQQGDKANARSYLERALASAADYPVMEQAIRVQLVELLIDLRAWQDAEQVLQAASEASFTAQIAALRGDLAYHQGNLAAARAAYQQAADQQSEPDPLLTLKLSDLGPDPSQE
ncbi:MAG: tetratricopeptide repeat protein [Pseudomonadota bacterium]